MSRHGASTYYSYGLASPIAVLQNEDTIANPFHDGRKRSLSTNRIRDVLNLTRCPFLRRSYRPLFLRIFHQLHHLYLRRFHRNPYRVPFLNASGVQQEKSYESSGLRRNQHLVCGTCTLKHSMGCSESALHRCWNTPHEQT